MAINNKPAEVYAPVHTEAKSDPEFGNGEKKRGTAASEVNMSVGNINRNGYDPKVENEGITIRGCGAATKGTKARGPMA
jgi:hypothetical protein